jgi:hypothetical protein
MDKIHEHKDSECCTPSSEPPVFYLSQHCFGDNNLQSQAGFGTR